MNITIQIEHTQEGRYIMDCYEMGQHTNCGTIKELSGDLHRLMNDVLRRIQESPQQFPQEVEHG